MIGGFVRGVPDYGTRCGRRWPGPPTQPPKLPLLPTCTPSRLTSLLPVPVACGDLHPKWPCAIGA